MNPKLPLISLIASLVLTANFALAQGPGGPGGPGGGSGDGIWTRNAAFGEAETFDVCNGHQPQTGMYHYHLNPMCLRAALDDNVVPVYTGRLGTQYVEKTAGWTHSPILGWSFDGYPVYGPYGYTNPMDSTSAIKRVQSGFQLRSITRRNTLPTWILPYETGVAQNLTSSQYGPAVSVTYPLGRYTQDYDYGTGSGDLDQYNGRFTVTPDFPNGTYAYFVTLDSNGNPAFPYVMNVQYYGAAAGETVTVPGDASEYFMNGTLAAAGKSNDPLLASWYTAGSRQDAMAISGWNPSAGASTTWPVGTPSGVSYSGGQSSPALADVQQIRTDSNGVYVNANNLPSYTIGPWFEATMTGGVFMNWASASSRLIQIPRNPTVATTKASTGMGPVGMWVNGVAIFNTLDGGSYSNSAGEDEGGGGISARATHLSAASDERGPIAQGSVVSAYPEFSATLATQTTYANTTPWPASLGGTTVGVKDSTGATTPAGILFASANQVNYQIPSTAATGPATVTIGYGGTQVSGTVNIVKTYPGIFKADSTGLAVGQVITAQSMAFISTAPINVANGPVYLTLYGTGIGTASTTATIGGVNAAIQSGPQGQYPGLDQVNLLIPAGLAGKGEVSVVVSAAGYPSNPVHVFIQ